MVDAPPVYPSGLIPAAYELGAGIQNLRFQVEYRLRFPGADRDHEGTDLLTCLSHVTRDRELLADKTEIDLEATRQALEEFERFTRSTPPEALSTASDSERRGYRREAERLWDGIARRSTQAIRENQPRLFKWFWLGDALGLCFYELLYPAQDGTLQGLGQLIKRASKLPQCYVNRPGVLFRLKDEDPSTASKDPASALNRIVKDPTFEGDPSVAEWSTIRLLARLEKSIRLDLAHELDGKDLQFYEDMGHIYAVLEGTPSAVNQVQRILLEEVKAAGGKWVAGPTIISKRQLPPETNLSQERRRLPEHLKCLVTTRKGRNGGGFGWNA